MYSTKEILYDFAKSSLGMIQKLTKVQKCNFPIQIVNTIPWEVRVSSKSRMWNYSWIWKGKDIIKQDENEFDITLHSQSSKKYY